MILAKPPLCGFFVHACPERERQFFEVPLIKSITMKKSPHTNLKTRTLDHLLENYRKSQYRTTRSGRRVRWDEPREGDSDEVRRHNDHLAERIQQRRDAKESLKKKCAVPTRDGNPIFEQNLMTEDLQRCLMAFRNLYASNRSMRFLDWIETIAELLDDL